MAVTASDVLDQAIMNGDIEPDMFDFRSKQEMMEELAWSKNEEEIWEYLSEMKREFV